MRLALLLTAVLLTVPMLAGCMDVIAMAGPETGPSLAESLMWPDSYPTLVVEVDAAQGAAPPQETLMMLRRTLADLTGKEHVVMFGPTYIGDTGDPLDTDHLRLLHRETADVATTDPGDHVQGEVATLHIVYLGGRMQDGDHAKTAGITLYEHGAVFIFPDTYRHLMRMESGRLVSAADDMGRLVLMHEVGHALGLLDRGAPVLLEREDPDHPGHSIEKDSVMSSGHSARNGIIQGDLDKHFTPADRADLAALRLQDPAS